MKSSLNIKTYIPEGFSKVCTVVNDGSGGWRYSDIDPDIMFDTHNSWIYFIVDGKEIVKVGESGNPLGIRGTRDPDHPVTGTKGRLGRYMTMPDNTDGRIRLELMEQVDKGQVTIWALKSQIIELPVIVGGKMSKTKYVCHKNLEYVYLDHIYEQTGSYPRLNHGRS